MFGTIKRYLLIGIVMLLMVGCAASRKETKANQPASKSPKVNESFDPLSLNDDDITFNKPSEKQEAAQPVLLPGKPDTPVLVNRQIDGFRVQILSTKNIENATTAKQIAKEQFSDLGVQLYLDFDSPYYKVRLGDFKTREEAERALSVVRSQGYLKAWIVPAKVWTNPDLSAPADSTSMNPPNFEN